MRLLPLSAHTTAEAEPSEAFDYLYEPSPARALDSLLRREVEVRLFQIFLESFAGEHGARMTAMDSATENASEMIASLTLTFNRARQAAITKELIEVVSGADALAGLVCCARLVAPPVWRGCCARQLPASWRGCVPSC